MLHNGVRNVLCWDPDPEGIASTREVLSKDSVALRRDVEYASSQGTRLEDLEGKFDIIFYHAGVPEIFLSATTSLHRHEGLLRGCSRQEIRTLLELCNYWRST